MLHTQMSGSHTSCPEKTVCLAAISLPWSPGFSLGPRPQKLSSPHPPQLDSNTKLSSLKLASRPLLPFSVYLARGCGLHRSQPMGATGRSQGGDRLWSPEGGLGHIKPSPNLPKPNLQNSCCLTEGPTCQPTKGIQIRDKYLRHQDTAQPLPLSVCSLALIWILIAFIWRFACLSLQPAPGRLD